jgi:hypothetical protein
MATNVFSNIDNIKFDSNISKLKANREYLLSKETTTKLNSYTGSNVFGAFNDLLEGNESAPAVRSIFNKFSGVLTSSTDKSGEFINRENIAGGWRISNNVPLIDNPKSRLAIKQLSGCSVKDLVKASENGQLGRATYDYSDFMYCKHLGKIPNNHLITLRRFPHPVDDYISTTGGTLSSRTEAGVSGNITCLGCLVNWLNTPGNEMSNILKYTVSMPFEEKNAKFEDIQGGNADSQTGFLPGMAALADKRYREQYMAGEASAAANEVLKRFFPKIGDAPYNAQEYANWKDENKVYGPVDAIKSAYMRSEKGLQFDQDITLTFDYELRSYNGINGRQAFLDLLANILTVTYTTGTFWGGQYKSNGAHQNNVFTNFKIFQARGGWSSYVDAFNSDALTVMNNIKIPTSLKDVTKGAGAALKQVFGMIIGGTLNFLGRPAKIYMNSLLTPQPVGFWHLMIGNPFHPIMSMGNMILKNATIEHYGPLGLDDFPTGIKVTCSLTRGRPRDNSEIERMYLNGNDRIYHPMGDKVEYMYYKAAHVKTKITNAEGKDEESLLYTDHETVTQEELTNRSKIIKKMFGHNDISSIQAASKEMGFGSQPKEQASRQLGVGN